jgi:hypothetical protein
MNTPEDILRQQLNASLNWWCDDAFSFEIHEDNNAPDYGYAWLADVVIRMWDQPGVWSIQMAKKVEGQDDDFVFLHGADAESDVRTDELLMWMLLSPRTNDRRNG